MRKWFAALLVSLVFIATAAAAELPLRVTGQTNSTWIIGWTPQSGAYGYRFFIDGKPVSVTFDGSRNSVTFKKGGTNYGVLELVQRDVGTINPSAPPPPPPPVGDVGNLWVDADGGSCLRNSTASAYNNASACPSFAAAYSAASSGDVIGVVGSLGIQKFAGGYQSSQPAGSKTITFKGVTGNKVRQIHFGSPNITFDGINADAGGTKTTGAVFENGGDPFVFKNGTIGGVVDEKGALVTGRGIFFDNVLFHDVIVATSGVHNECIWAGVPEGMVIRNSTFRNCATMDVFFTYPDYWVPLPAPYGNVTLEGNQFGAPKGLGGNETRGYALYIGKNGQSLSNQTPMSGWRVMRNHVEDVPGTDLDYGVNSDQPLGSNNVFCGNTGKVPSSWAGAC